MSKAWTGKSEYNKFSDELVKSQDREFEKLVLSLIRVIWPTAGFRPPEMGWIDKRGIDLLAWSDFQPYPLAVQCKGFKVPEEEIDQSQIEQCLKSITSFRESGIKVDTYLLIHNRTGKNTELRSSIEASLEKLVESGKAQRAELWDRQKLLREVFNATVQLVRSAVEKKRAGAQAYYGDYQICQPLEQVPFTKSELIADPNRLITSSKPIFRLSDPVSELLSSDGSNLVLMIGEAGYGKTTAVLRTFTFIDHLIFYIPAATIPNHVNSTTGLLRHCIRVQDLFDSPPNSDAEIFDRLFNTAIRYILKESSLPVTLLIDGLDESVYFSRRGGLQSLFNQLREIRVPVVLTARKEFWAQRQQDFTDLFGFSGKLGEKQHRRIKLIELQEWRGEQIARLAAHYKDTLTDGKKRENIENFIEVVNSNEYEDYYGDIPKRPLFLRFILETVADNGLHRTGKAKLYYEWAEAKIRRDIYRPMIWGHVGRQPIISEMESPDETLRLAFRAMMLASERMINIRGKDIELLPDCSIDSVLLTDEKLKGVFDPTGLFLNSLLVPLLSPPHESLRVKFAHRTYQEFFLALSIRKRREYYKDYNLPAPVVEHIINMENEGL
jgi:hypothetical protein